MARHVRISTIGAQQFMAEKPRSYQDAVDQMIAHWRKELDQVLSDKPDLIVLPEVCDRPANYNSSAEKIAAYLKVRGRQVQDFMAGVARKHHCYIAYAAERDMEDGTSRNSTVGAASPAFTTRITWSSKKTRKAILSTARTRP